MLLLGRSIGKTLLAAIVLASSASSWAQYPTKPITLVSPYVGGVPDALPRLIAEQLSKELGQPVLVEPKPGANGIIAANDVIGAKPDGYRLLFAGNGALTVAPAMMTKVPYDAVKDLTPLAAPMQLFLYYYLSKSVPAKTFAEFVELARKNPGKYFYAAMSGTSYLGQAYMFNSLNIKVEPVQYKGEAPGVLDLVSGRVDILIGTPSVYEYVKSGQILAVANIRSERSPMPGLSEVPTLKELGFSSVDKFPAPWFSIFGPAKLPEPIAKKLADAIRKVMNNPANKKTFEDMQITYKDMPQNELANTFRDDRDFYIKAVNDAGIPKQ